MDHGDWSNALHLIPMPDILSDPDFGGDDFEMRMIQAYRKAMRELKSKHEGGGHPEKDDGVGGGGGDKGDGEHLTAKQGKAAEWKAKQKAKREKEKGEAEKTDR